MGPTGPTDWRTGGWGRWRFPHCLHSMRGGDLVSYLKQTGGRPRSPEGDDNGDDDRRKLEWKLTIISCFSGARCGFGFGAIKQQQQQTLDGFYFVMRSRGRGCSCIQPASATFGINLMKWIASVELVHWLLSDSVCNWNWSSNEGQVVKNERLGNRCMNVDQHKSN